MNETRDASRNATSVGVRRRGAGKQYLHVAFRSGLGLIVGILCSHKKRPARTAWLRFICGTSAVRHSPTEHVPWSTPAVTTDVGRLTAAAIAAVETNVYGWGREACETWGCRGGERGAEGREEKASWRVRPTRSESERDTKRGTDRRRYGGG